MRVKLVRIELAICGLLWPVLAAGASNSESFAVSGDAFIAGGGTTASSSFATTGGIGHVAPGGASSASYETWSGSGVPEQVASGVPASDIPLVFSVLPNSPNPFSEHTVFRYALPVPSAVQLQVYSLGGRRIRALITASQVAGWFSLVWDGRDTAGHRVPSGVYFYRLSTEENVHQGRLVLLRE